LEKIKWNDTVELIDAKRVSTVDELKEFYNESLEKGFEGVMAKKLDSTYDVGKRNNNWVKLKPTITVDCIVMGWYKGNGCRETWAKDGPGLGAFLFGVYNPETKKYETLVKAGTGLNKEWAIELLEKVREIESEEMPGDYVAPKEKEPDYWVSPEYVIELRGQQITKSPAHSCGYSLRFPTLRHLRQDKKAKDSTTVSEIEEMFAE
jgi:DNA ligase-1